MSPLPPLQCTGCAAPMPLVDAPRHTCAFCQTVVVTPPSYLNAVTGHRDAVAARKAAEPKWQRLAAGSSPWWQRAGGALMVLAPPSLTFAGFAVEPAQATSVVFGLFTLPSLFPGGILFVWGATADLTRSDYRDALAARPPDKDGAPPCCRECGAPLAVESGEVGCTCLYCGTDSIVHDIAHIATERRRAVGSLTEATRALRRRLWSVRLALVGLGVLLLGLMAALHLAQQQLQ